MIYKMSRFGCHNDVGDEDGDDGIVGQDPDQLRGGFDGEQAFRGDLTQLNIWDYLLPNSIIGQLGRLAMFSLIYKSPIFDILPQFKDLEGIQAGVRRGLGAMLSNGILRTLSFTT